MSTQSPSMNFLPDAYRASRRRRTMRRIEIISIIILTGCFGLAWGELWQQREQLANRVTQAETQAARAFQLRNELAELEAQRAQLYNQSALYRTLEPPLRAAQTLRILAHTLPEAVGLVDLSLTHTSGADQKLTIDLRALCTDDRQVAAAVAALATHPLFTEIEVQSVGPVETDDASLRELSLLAHIDLNRKLAFVTPDHDDNPQTAAVETGP
ncbi:hypothetical protein [Mucisphaera sp.]|uniref:hypothetical protein n=1 Tax=Mucisphaera sp. TaxID=2913024 RepID=UPI003D09EC1B